MMKTRKQTKLTTLLLSASLLATGLAACSGKPAVELAADSAHFSDIKMVGSDNIQRAGGEDMYSNPILPGYFPDPSIERVGDDYYLINSSFTHFPGIPIHHSKDLVNWKQIGNAIDRPEQLNFMGIGISRGVFAPAIAHHDGIFYIVNTCVDCKGQFVITATDPAGPWSDPVWLDFGGIDPSLYFDDDGKAWVMWNDAPNEKPRYDGHRAIWIQEFDYKNLKVVGPKTQIINGGIDISKKPVWIEGPHINKVDGKYYLTAAEGGTSVNHSQVVLISDNVTGPYKPWSINPILTQRDLDPTRPQPVSAAGHADMVQTPNGDWWAVFLATRPYEKDYYNIGRETFLLPVKWIEDAAGLKGPVILDKGLPIPYEGKRPLPAVGEGESLTVTGYTPENKLKWLHVRNPEVANYKAGDNGSITVTGTDGVIGNLDRSPSFVGLRQLGPLSTFESKVQANLTPGARAGQLSVQSDEYWFFCGLEGTADGVRAVAYTRAGKDDPIGGVLVAEKAVDATARTFSTVVTNGEIACKYDDKGTLVELTPPGTNGRHLSTNVSGGFVGTVTGPYVSKAITQ